MSREFCFQVNRSSLLVPEQVTKPQEVNGTNGNGKAALPIADAAAKRAEHSTDSEQDEAGDTDEPGNSKSQSTFCVQSAKTNHKKPFP